MMRGVAWGPGLLLFSHVVTACSLSAIVDSPGRLRCSVRDDYQRLVRPVAAPSDDYIRVPVVVRIMEPGNGHIVQDQWTHDLFSRVFAQQGPLGVNDVWKAAHIRFDVLAVEECRFTPPPPLTVPCDPGPGIPKECIFTVIPEDSQHTWRLFEDDLLGSAARQLLDTNRWYGSYRKVNVYLWWNLHAGRGDGWGESPRRRREAVRHKIGPADETMEVLSTVWLGTECADFTEESCQLHVAHELGHALGLPHTCWELPEGPEEVSLCGMPFDLCSSTNDEQLMRPGVTGGNLCPSEKAAARAGARDFFFK